MSNGQETAIVPAKPQVLIGNAGIQLRTMDELYRFAKAVKQSELAPPDDTEQMILVKMQYGMEIGLKGPMSALKNIFVVNGRPSVFGAATLGLVYQSGLMESISETIDGEGDDMIATCTTKRKGMAETIRSFSVADAKEAKLWGKSGPWTQYKKRMLQFKARNLALNDAFADVFMGVDVVEEVRDIDTEYNTSNMPQTTPRAERTPDEPVTVTLQTARYDLVKEFRSQAEGINPDATEIDKEHGFYDYMAFEWGGGIADWSDLDNAKWTVGVCVKALEELQADGISSEIGCKYFEGKMPTGDMFEKGEGENG